MLVHFLWCFEIPKFQSAHSNLHDWCLTYSISKNITYDVFILFFSWLKVWVCSIVQVKVWCQLTHIHAARASQSTAWSAWVRGGPGPPLPPSPSKNLRDQTGSLTWFSDFWYHFFYYSSVMSVKNSLTNTPSKNNLVL